MLRERPRYRYADAYGITRDPARARGCRARGLPWGDDARLPGAQRAPRRAESERDGRAGAAVPERDADARRDQPPAAHATAVADPHVRGARRGRPGRARLG